MSTLRIAADVNELAALRQFVREEARRAGASREAIDDMVQAVDESVTNTIVHGYQGGQGSIDVDVHLTGDSLIVRVRDQAPPFDPTALPSPDISLPLNSRPPHGMGVYLTRELTDEMTYRKTSEGNELTLVKLSISAREVERETRR